MRILLAFILTLAALRDLAEASPLAVQIKIQREKGLIMLPLNQPLSAWTKYYGMGYHNADVPALMGWTMSWTFHRVTMAATFTGQPLVATRVAFGPKEGQFELTLKEATVMANRLGLLKSQPDPNFEGAPLWPGEHINVRFSKEKLTGFTMIELWTDKFPDPNGNLPEPE